MAQQKPLIHLNGSGAERLLTQRSEALDALRDAIDKLRAMWPHARDYYPLGPDAIGIAEGIQSERVQALQQIADDITGEIETLLEEDQ